MTMEKAVEIADNCIRVARSLYAWDVRHLGPGGSVPFDALPERTKIMYFEQADWAVSCLDERERVVG